MSKEFVVYIDESGDEGFTFDKTTGNSSSWFVLSGVITKKSEDLEVVKLIDEARRLLGKPPKKPLHFRDLKHEQKIPFLNLISKANLSIINILIHKPSLRSPETFKEKYRLYFYSVRFLLERVSWYCRDSNPSNRNCEAEIIFSNRSGMSYSELRDYIDLLKTTNNNKIHWPAISSDAITSYSAGKRMGLQIADATATSFFKAIEPSNYGYTETKYVSILKPTVYNRNQRFKNYGIKVWPSDTDLISEQTQWIEDLYEV